MRREPAPAQGVKPVRLDVATLLRERLTIRRSIRRRGVRVGDVDDLVADVIAAAWTAIEFGRYRPDPTVDPTDALRRWLDGIARNLTSHHLGRASYRRDVATDPDELARLLVGPNPERRLTAREDLAVVRALVPTLRAALAAKASGATFAETEAALGVPGSTVAKRFYRARAALLRAMSRAR